MATISILEIRIKKDGPVFKRNVFIDNTNGGSLLVDGWVYDNKLKLEKFIIHNYNVEGNSLNLFISCEGRAGGKIICEVLINNKLATDKITQNTKIESENISDFPTKGEYQIS